jgi:hypothetical protein
MAIEAKVKIVGGKWTVNGIPLSDYNEGEKWMMHSLVEKLIETKKPVTPELFFIPFEPPIWEDLDAIKPTVSRFNLKKMNYKFPDWVLNKGERPIYHQFEDVYPDISKITFVRAVDKINGAFQKGKTILNETLTK